MVHFSTISCLRLPVIKARQLSAHIKFISSLNTKLPSSDELFEQTEGRWLYNEAQQQDIRRVNFNVSELVRIGCEAAGTTVCLSMDKIAEGSFNKVFRLSFDNSQSIIARLPSSRMFGSGTSHIVSSEVATMSLASKSGIHTPRVISWSKGYDNPVGWPYILMEDIDGTTLHHEWPQPETRGEPVARLLTQVASSMQKMMSSNFSRIGSPYLVEDLPDSANLPPATEFEIENGVRIGPIADLLWWRCYHDEPHFDRGPWNTIEEYLMAAVRLERRAVERHRQDPSSLAYTKSSIEDLDEVEDLLSKVEAIAPHIQDLIERAYHTMPKRLMQICFMHPDLLTQNIMVPTLTADNALTRMLDPVFIDWQGTCALPLALQWYTPAFVEYKARLLDLKTGRPILKMPWDHLAEVPLPKNFDQLDPEFQEIIRTEHEAATRRVRWNQWFTKHPEFAPLILSFPMQSNLRLFTQYILRACADGPFRLRKMLWDIELAWYSDEEEETSAPCPFTIGLDMFELMRKDEPHLRYQNARSKLMKRLRCTVDGLVLCKDYEASMKELELARNEWDETSTGGPFPFEDGKWGQYLR